MLVLFIRANRSYSGSYLALTNRYLLYTRLDESEEEEPNDGRQIVLGQSDGGFTVEKVSKDKRLLTIDDFAWTFGQQKLQRVIWYRFHMKKVAVFFNFECQSLSDHTTNGVFSSVSEFFKPC